MIIQLTPFGKGSSIAIRFNSLLIFIVSLRTFSLFLRWGGPHYLDNGKALIDCLDAPP
jgi:hypothetical protein